MRVNDIVSGAILLLLGAAVAAHALGFPAAHGQTIGPGVFPGSIGLGLVLAGALLMRSGWRQTPRAPAVEWDEGLRQPRFAANGALVIGTVIFYALAVERVGFFPSAFVMLAVLFLAFGVSRRWIAPLAAAVTFGLHFAFYSLLSVPLPWGWLERFAW